MQDDQNTKSEEEKGQVLAWGVERRLEFIEFRLYWEERINRGDLITFFNISVPQASADLTKYQELAPGNMLYDTRRKFYYASPTFQPKLSNPSAEQYLMRYVAEASGLLRRHKSFLGFIPPADIVPVPWRRVDPDILKSILRAIRWKKDIAIEYQSMRRPDKTIRWISPHALGYDGFRWHCRAYCHIDHTFKDFNLGRIFSVRDQRDSQIDAKTDVKWETMTTVRIGPDPALSGGQKKVIEHEYGMTNGEAAIQVRSAMLYYFLGRLGLEFDKRDDQKRHIILLNKNEVQAAYGSGETPSIQT
jgi:WYL domain